LGKLRRLTSAALEIARCDVRRELLSLLRAFYLGLMKLSWIRQMLYNQGVCDHSLASMALHLSARRIRLEN
jgi:hypothetical protein